MHGFPLAFPGQTIGLLGGSFDPPHLGHVHISHRALRRFRLDQVWWLVSPGNPLKADAPAALARRMSAARALVDHPRIRVTDMEARLGTRYTADTLRAVRARYTGVRFVWLMGADNLVTFHRWEQWQDIMRSIPVGVLARPGEQIRAGLSPAARMFANYRLPCDRARGLARHAAPAWTLMSGPMIDTSSTELRENGVWIR
ncbi:nicotinate-nucleotide adenylyltransferase [Oceanibium sediminis]|uniref:nicotinate-nucleotide adenylyltransferase n=1 Tax=Oceanibium sediminis TaxID=2026339 RepID=UPI000DD44D1F|nr:nicotinate-nucleotide adenylyltransferase [Oceanibium sediminis]